MARFGYLLVALVMALALLDWVGWATGTHWLTRIIPIGPPMMPWTAAWLTMLGTAILLQTWSRPASRIWVARGLAGAVAVLGALVAVEYATTRPLGLDEAFFAAAVRAEGSAWPGRPGLLTSLAVICLSVVVGLAGADALWARRATAVSRVGAVAIPMITPLVYLFGTADLVDLAKSAGGALASAVGLVLLTLATVLLDSGRSVRTGVPAGPGQRTLFRIGVAITSFPVLVGLAHRGSKALGLAPDVGLALATVLGAVVVGAATFFLSRREQRLVEAIAVDRELLRANADGMLDPQVLLAAVRDPAGRVVDLVYRRINRAAVDYLGRTEPECVDRSIRSLQPELEESGLMRDCLGCLESGEPVVRFDFALIEDTGHDSSRYDIRVTRAGADLLSFTWSDVTERSRAAQRVAASERNYRLIAENSGDMVVHVRDGRFVWVSPSVEAVLGAPPPHWVGRSVREVIPAEDAAEFAERLRILTAGGVIQRRVRVVSVDGVTHWVHLHAKPFRAEDGSVDGIAAALRLIDDEVALQRQAEEARAEQAKSDQRYRRSMDSASVGMCLAAPDGRFVDVNDALCELFGYDEAVLKQKTWQELTAADYLQADLKNVDEVLAGRSESYRMVKQYIHSSGRPIWGELSVSCIRDADGRVENFISQINDITAMVELNDQNRKLALRLQQQTDQLMSELDSAAGYLASIMPTGLTGEVAASSRYFPARGLGGDCFDYVWIDDDHLIVYLIDVSGHGIEPALLAVSVHNMLRSGSFGPGRLLRPDVLLCEMNRRFPMQDQGDHYFTLWFGVYEPSTRTLRYVAAGAPPALAFGPGKDGVAELSGTSPPIGLFEDSEFGVHTYQVPAGGRILLFSDGAFDVPMVDGRMLTLADFEALATRLSRRQEWFLDELTAEVLALTPVGAFEDDCSLIQLRFD